MTKEKIMPFEKFEYIMKMIQDFLDKKHELEKFFENNVLSTHCQIDMCDPLVTSLVRILADEFDCWYYAVPCGREEGTVLNPETKEYVKFEDFEFPKKEDLKWWEYKGLYWDNDIEYWMWEMHGEKELEGRPVNTLRQFYDYLVENKRKV